MGIDLHIVTQQVVGGLAVGCVYALIALGFTMMLRATELVNFAQGELVMSGAFIGYTLLVVTPLPYLAVFIVASILTGILGMLIERVALRPIRMRQSPLLNLIIATIGIGICLRLVSQLIWGAAPLRYPVSVGQVGHLVVAGLPMSIQHIWIIALAILSMLGLHYFFERTLPGIAWRASAYDSYTAEILGVSFDRVVTMTFGISSMLAGAAGVLIAPLFFVAQDLWLQGPRSFAGAALGQFHILGTMIGGPILGLLETFAAGYISSAYKNGIAFGVTIIVLMLVAIPRMPRGGSLVFRYGRQSIADLFELNDKQAARLRYAMSAALGVLAFLLPLLLDTYEVYLVTLILIYATGALGLQLVIGYAGAIIVGHAAFLGIGAYTSAILTVYLGVPFLPAMIAAAIVAAVFALLFGPILRLPTHFCAIATLGFGEIMHLVFINWKAVTNGMSGISGIRKPSIGSFVFGEGAPFYFLTIAVLVVVFVALQRLIRSRYGRGLVAARENELAAISMGVNVAWYRTLSFCIAAGCAGIAGSLYAHFFSYISPDSFTILQSIAFLTMVVIGGLGSFAGAVIGAFFVLGVPEMLRTLAEYRILIFGLLLVAFMMFLPGGLADLVHRLLSAFRRKEGTPDVSAVSSEQNEILAANPVKNNVSS